MKSKKMMSDIFEGALVEKKNTLNEIRRNDMSLSEIRLFSVYLAKINARDISTRVVRFSLKEFILTIGIGTDINLGSFKEAVQHLLQRIVEVPNEEDGGYTAFQLFKSIKIAKDKAGQWYVELDAHDNALPLMFDLKDRYFSYPLKNALKLKSVHQFRLYEILKQYEKIGRRELTIENLRELLGVKSSEHLRVDSLKRLIDFCQKAIEQNTDINFTYECGKRGDRGKWKTIVFYIKPNIVIQPDYAVPPFCGDKSSSDIEQSFDFGTVSDIPQSFIDDLDLPFDAES